jgi:hypothetical protein
MSAYPGKPCYLAILGTNGRISGRPSLPVGGRADLRAHSDLMWNRAVNTLIAAHLSWADFKIEAKAKNLAADDLERDLLAAGFLRPEPAGAA